MEFNATLIAQIIDLLLVVAFVIAIYALISRRISYQKKVNKDIETMANEIKEMRKTLQERK